jgi:hypothetical protein
MELAVKIESSLALYLASFSTWPDSLLAGTAPPTYSIFAGEAETEKTGQSIICYVNGDLAEEPARSGNFWADVQIELKTPVIADTPDATTALDSHQQAATVLEPLILASDLSSQLESLVVDYTIFGLLDRQPIRERTPEYWLTGWKFRLYCCSSALTP